jgi:hypothetical protein
MEARKQYSDRKVSGFFRGLPTSFPFFPAGNVRKSLEKIRKYSGWNAASMFYHFPAAGIIDLGTADSNEIIESRF